MKYVGLIVIVLFVGCAQLQHGQIQPVVTKDVKKGILFTSCSGVVENWASCVNKAMKACPAGYQVIDKKETTESFRELTFKCK